MKEDKGSPAADQVIVSGKVANSSKKGLSNVSKTADSTKTGCDLVGAILGVRKRMGMQALARIPGRTDRSWKFELYDNVDGQSVDDDDPTEGKMDIITEGLEQYMAQWSDRSE